MKMKIHLPSHVIIMKRYYQYPEQGCRVFTQFRQKSGRPPYGFRQVSVTPPQGPAVDLGYWLLQLGSLAHLVSS